MSQPSSPLPKKGKILALDIGTRRTGVAISDPSQTVAFARDEILHSSTEELIVQLGQVIEKDDIVGILAGMPISMNGEMTRQTAITMEMVEEIKEAFKLPIELMDERLTSQLARATSPKDSHVDSRAAQLMLEIRLG